MNARNDSVLIPSLHDTFTDAHARGAAVPDEVDGVDDSEGRHRADDPQYVADMQRLEAARAIGYVDAACLGCGTMLFVPEGRRCGDVLCAECQREGEALAAAEDGDDDDRDPPPAAAAPVPERSDPEYFAPVAGRLADDSLVSAVDLAGRDPARLGLDTSAVQAAALAAFTSEVLRRLDARKAA